VRDIEIIEPDGAFTSFGGLVYRYHCHNKGAENCFNEGTRIARGNISLSSGPHGIGLPEELLETVQSRRGRSHGSH
jgi:hypothetical protein